MLWVILAITAAGFQALRFMLQKKLSMAALSAGGATWARFVYAAPFAIGVTLVYMAVTGTPLPALGLRFWGFAMLGGLAQILATWAVVALFARRNFAVGITFKKTEVLQAALVGFVVLGDRVSAAGLVAIALGTLGVVVLSGTRGLGGRDMLNRAAGMGLLAGALFAVSAVTYRGAVLAVPGDAFFRAVLTLSVVTLSQTLAVSAWLWRAQPGQITATLAAWPSAIWIGLAGVMGSIGWFAAFALQNAAYVFAVGQIEVIFSILIGRFFFGERLSAREGLGIALVTVSILALVLYG
ncbi:MAG TPA: DMT family transporter [Aliiroseovarius sp.]|nr:DMT family transporter [Aliiroseovarius sp.]